MPRPDLNYELETQYKQEIQLFLEKVGPTNFLLLSHEVFMEKARKVNDNNLDYVWHSLAKGMLALTKQSVNLE